MIDLTIIIPHYNSVNLLKKLISTIPNKKNIQTIIIDDDSNSASNDFSEIIKNNKHITFLKNNTSSKGAGACRNIGLKNAKGRWVLFADSDDFFLKGFYSIVSKYFESSSDIVFFKPSSIDLITGTKSDRHLKYERLINHYIQKKDLESEIKLKYQFVVPWSKLINRKFIEEYNISFDEVIAANDVMFSTKVGYNLREFEVCTEVIYCVTKSIGTLTTNLRPEVYDARLFSFIKYQNFIRENLNKEELKYLYINGLGLFLDVFRYKLGFKKAISVLCLLMKNKVPLFNVKFLNPIFFFKKVKQYYVRVTKKKKYS